MCAKTERRSRQAAERRLSEPVPMSRPGASGCGMYGVGCDRSAGARAYLGARPDGPGDEMVDGSFRGRRLRPLGLVGSAARRGRVSWHSWDPAGSLRVIGWRRPLDAIGRRGQAIGASASARVHARRGGTAGELARDRDRGARVREAAGLERNVVGVVGAGGLAGSLGGFLAPVLLCSRPKRSQRAVDEAQPKPRLSARPLPRRSSLRPTRQEGVAAFRNVELSFDS
jgi:hypothetical protein